MTLSKQLRFWQRLLPLYVVKNNLGPFCFDVTTWIQPVNRPADPDFRKYVVFLLRYDSRFVCRDSLAACRLTDQCVALME